MVFTSVRTEVARAVLATLVEYGDAPEAVADLEVVAWRGPVKDLAFITGALPEEVLLVDDQERVIAPTQRAQWIPITEWDAPYDPADGELERVRAAISARQPD